MLTPLAVLAAASLATGQDPRAVVGSVFLQNVTPGSVQNGHAALTGTFLAGKVGVGTVSPLGQVGVVTTANVGVHSQASRTAVFGKSNQSTSSAYGGYFAALSDGGTGVYGEALSPSGTTYGVFGRAASPSGYAGYFSGRGFFSGSVGIGTQSPSALLDVNGSARFLGLKMPTGATAGHVLTSDSLGNASWQPVPTGLVLPFAGTVSSPTPAFSVSNTGGSTALIGMTQSTTAGSAGVRGESSASSGLATGGYFLSSSSQGRGIYGEANAPSGSTYGGMFRTLSPTGIGVFGWATANSGNPIAVLGESTAPDGIGIKAVASNQGGVGIQVRGASRGVDIEAKDQGLLIDVTAAGAGGIFVKCDTFTPGGTGKAIHARTASADGQGVFGHCSTGNGIGSGVYGMCTSPNGFGVYSSGNMGASGNKPFCIDHPLDPERSFLYHYASEGPEPLLVYSGTVSTDRRGFAWVRLPDYFDSINRDPRYQLTVVGSGQTWAQARVSSEVHDNRFQIQTSQPNVKVCWEVTGVRNDRWNRVKGAPIEVAKPTSLQGLYLEPELYGKPASLRISNVAGQARDSHAAGDRP